MNIEDYRASVPAVTNQILDLLISGTPNKKKLSYPLNFVIKTNPNKLAFTSDGVAPSAHIDQWLRDHCKKGCGPLLSYTHFGFEDGEEAMLFKLTWG
jgi:hypothetical protein